jgi:hypothetical protein
VPLPALLLIQKEEKKKKKIQWFRNVNSAKYKEASEKEK